MIPAPACGPITNAAEWMLSGGEADAPAVLCGDEVVTYGQLRAGRRLRGQACWTKGLLRATASGCWRRTARSFVAAYLGAMQAGLCAVPLPIGESEKTLERIRGRHGAGPHRGLRPAAAEVAAAGRQAGRRPAGRVARLACRGAAGAAGDRSAPRPGRDHATSGSTGEPKGVMVTHGNILCNTRDIIDYMGLAAAKTG